MADGQVDTELSNRGYVHPEVLVSTRWLADHLNDAVVQEDFAFYGRTLSGTDARLAVQADLAPAEMDKLLEEQGKLQDAIEAANAVLGRRCPACGTDAMTRRRS